MHPIFVLNKPSSWRAGSNKTLVSTCRPGVTRLPKPSGNLNDEAFGSFLACSIHVGPTVDGLAVKAGI